MVVLRCLDAYLLESQRQGRISFYLTHTGEEGLQVGSAAALDPTDVIYGQYRELGVLLSRGYTLEEVIAQCMGSVKDKGKGRQMPVHYGSDKLRYHTVSSPLGTQLPQAAGCGYGLRMEKGPGRVCVCYFGDGAASEGDFHAALNMAATLRCRTIFFCRNNGYAISTPCVEQYAGDGIGCRGSSYGIPSIRVDGNDVLAVFEATRQARKLCIEENKPVLIEALTYREGHHSSSDDSSCYRNNQEMQEKAKKALGDPIQRFEKYLEGRNLWNPELKDVFLQNTRQSILKLLHKHENLPKLSPVSLLDDVYDVKSPHLQTQQQELDVYLQKYHKTNNELT